MRIGIIDLGTNSVRFDVHQLGPGNRVRTLHREKLMVRLGQGVFLDGKLDPTAIRRTLEAFTSFARTARELQTEKIVAFGTSALREASDSEKLLTRIKAHTGIEIRVISGQEEAKLIAEGILAHVKPPKGCFGLIDIGGGSVEISICRNKTVLHAESFPLGTARLQQVFLKSSPPPSPFKGQAAPIDQLRRYIKSILLPKMLSEGWPKVTRIYGSSGTIKAIAKLCKWKAGGSAKSIDLGELKKLSKLMATHSTTQLLGMPGMEARRVDMILAGAILLEESLEAVRAKKVITTDYSLRDGILEEELKVFRKHEKTHLAFHFDDFYAKARRMGVTDTHLKQVTALTDTLYDRFRPLHKLKPEWKNYLKAAAILHDTGEAITPTRHAEHSYYIVKNADFPALEKWETDFIAELCLRHQGGKFELKDLPFKGKSEKDKERRHAFPRLLALLRLADALDRGHKSNVRIKRVRLTRREVHLHLSGTAVDLELLRVEQKKGLFEQVFDRKLVVVKS